MAELQRGDLRLGWLVAAVVILEFVVIVIFMPSHRVNHYYQTERQSVSALIGSPAEEKINHYAQSWYQFTVVTPGLPEALNEFLFGNPTPDYSDPGGSVRRYSNDHLKTFWRLVFLVYYRFAMVAVWLPYLLPLIIPLIFDAQTERRVRQWRFSYVSPMRRSVAAKMTASLGGALGISVLLPLHVPVLVYPLLIVLIFAVSWIWVANLQKRL